MDRWRFPLQRHVTAGKRVNSSNIFTGHGTLPAFAMTEFVKHLLTRIPEGRMLKVRTIETALRTGLSYAAAASKARVCMSSATGWAALLSIRKRDLAAETPDERRTRHESWALALAELGRMDEAAAWEAEARKLETTFTRIGRRAASVGAENDHYSAARAFLARVAACSAPAADMAAAWGEVFTYYQRLQALGAGVQADGRVTWPEGQPVGLPATPRWLPCDPWAVEDVPAWDAAVGDAVRML